MRPAGSVPSLRAAARRGAKRSPGGSASRPSGQHEPAWQPVCHHRGLPCRLIPARIERPSSVATSFGMLSGMYCSDTPEIGRSPRLIIGAPDKRLTALFRLIAPAPRWRATRRPRLNPLYRSHLSSALSRASAQRTRRPASHGPTSRPYQPGSTSSSSSAASSAGGTSTTSSRSTSSATRTPPSAGRSSTARSPPTTRWASTTPGAAPTRTSTSATRPCSASKQRYQNGFDCQGLWVEVEVEKELGLQEQARHRDLRHRRVRRGAARSACCRFAAHPDRAVDPPRLLDGLGQLATSRCRTRTTTPSGASSRVPRARLDLPGPRRHALVPALRHRHLRARDRHRGLPGGHPHVSVFVQASRCVDRAGRVLLVWTTTPWTLPANVAAAVNPELTYLSVRAGRRRLLRLARAPAKTPLARRARGRSARSRARELVGLHLPRPVRRAAGAAGRRRTGSSPGTTSATPRAPASSTSPRAPATRTSRSRKEYDLAVIAPLDEDGIYLSTASAG